MRRATPPTSAATRSFISAAALFVNVIARIENGDASRSAIRYASRCVSTRVLPDPAPAITSTGPTGSVTASRCAGLRPVEIEVTQPPRCAARGAAGSRRAGGLVGRVEQRARGVDHDAVHRTGAHRHPTAHTFAFTPPESSTRVSSRRNSSGCSRDLRPGREDDSIAVTPGHAPLVVVALVVGGVVVPATAVRLEDRARPLEAEVEAVGAPFQVERELAHEVGEPVRDEQAAGLHLQRRTRRRSPDRAGRADRAARRRPGRPRAEPLEIRAQRRNRREPPAPSVFARDLEAPRRRARARAPAIVASTPVTREPADAAASSVAATSSRR